MASWGAVARSATRPPTARVVDDGTCQTQCPDNDEYVCRSNYAPTPRPVAAPKSSGNYAPTYQPTESEDRRLAGAPTLRGSYSA